MGIAVRQQISKKAETTNFVHKVIGIILAAIIVLFVFLPLSANIISWFMPAKESRDALGNINGMVLELKKELEEQKKTELTTSIPVSIHPDAPIIVAPRTDNRLCVENTVRQKLGPCKRYDSDVRVNIVGSKLDGTDGQLINVEITVKKISEEGKTIGVTIRKK